MLEKFRFLLLFNVSSYLINLSNSLEISIQKSNEFDELTNVLAFSIPECNLGLQSLIIYDDSKNVSIFKSLSILEPPVSVLLKSNLSERYGEQSLTDFTNQGIVLAGNINKKSIRRLINDSIQQWQCFNKNCTIFVLLDSYECTFNIASYVALFVKESIKYAYFICHVRSSNIPSIFTYDLIDDTKKPHWVQSKLKVGLFKKTMYIRHFKKDIICKEFAFARKDPMEESVIQVAGGKHDVNNQAPNILNIGKLLSKQFSICILLKGNYNFMLRAATERCHYDLFLYDLVFDSSKLTTDFSFPILYQPCVILSKHRGFATPIEKFAKFYGFWTLISMIFILLMTFVVIWLKTSKDISAAGFDILNLLTNSAVAVPINTISLRMFFSVIFLYFLIIHATFSGHLAKFLTVPALRKNIDTVEDLKNPRVTKIYDFFCFSENIKNEEVLARKRVYSEDVLSCAEIINKIPGAVCLGPLHDFRVIIFQGNLDNELYIGKETISYTASKYIYRKGFPLKDKVDWALMVLFETSLLNFQFNKMKVEFDLNLLVNKIRSEIDYRPIKPGDLKVAFILLIVGNGLGIICFVEETCFSRRKIIAVKIKNCWKNIGSKK